MLGVTSSIRCMYAASVSADRRPTPLRPTSSRLPPGRDSTRSKRASRCSTSGKSSMLSSFTSRSYMSIFCATIDSKSSGLTGASVAAWPGLVSSAPGAQLEKMAPSS
eukprot:1933617-Pyramimonas_sp.AAC.3